MNRGCFGLCGCTVPGALFSVAWVLLVASLSACGGSSSTDSCPGAACPADAGSDGDATTRMDAPVPEDVAIDRSARDGATPKGDGGDGGRPRDGGDSGPHDAGSDATDAADATPSCGSTPTLLVPANAWGSDAATSTGVPSVALEGSELYFVIDQTLPCFADGGCSGTAGAIWSVPVSGGAAAPVVSGLGVISAHFATTSTSLVFGAYEKPGSPYADGYVYSVPLGGGAITTLASAVGGAGFVATDAVNAYFDDDDGVKSVPLSGGSPIVLTTSYYFSFAPIGGALVLADFSNNVVQSLALDGGALSLLAPNQLGPLYPLSCASAICWANAGDIAGGGGLPGGEGDIVQRAGGTNTALSKSAVLFEPTGMVFDGQDFFVTAGGGPFGNLSRVPGMGGPPVSLVTYSGSNGAAVDEACVYWADALGGVYSLVKASPGGFSVK